MISKLIDPVQKFITENTPVILTGAGVVGSVATTVLTGRATIKACEIVNVEKQARQPTAIPTDEPPEARKISKEDTIKLVWKEYIPVVGSLGATVFCIIAANRLSAKEAAALAAAYGITQDKFTDYREKVREQFGDGKERKVRDEAAQEKVNEFPPQSGQVIITGNGDVMCLDTYSARYFECNVETIKGAVNQINKRILEENSASLTDFYNEVGLSKTGFSDDVGWNTKNLLDVDFLATLMEDGKPCLVLDFQIHPHYKFDELF